MRIPFPILLIVLGLAGSSLAQNQQTLVPTWNFAGSDGQYRVATGSITAISLCRYKLHKKSNNKTYDVTEMILETVAGPSVRIYHERDTDGDKVKGESNDQFIDIKKAAEEIVKTGTTFSGTGLISVETQAADPRGDTREEDAVTKAKTEIKANSASEVTSAYDGAYRAWMMIGN